MRILLLAVLTIGCGKKAGDSQYLGSCVFDQTLCIDYLPTDENKSAASEGCKLLKNAKWSSDACPTQGLVASCEGTGEIARYYDATQLDAAEDKCATRASGKGTFVLAPGITRPATYPEQKKLKLNCDQSHSKSVRDDNS